MRLIIAVCAVAIGAVVWAAWPRTPDSVMMATAVQIEGVREQRQDAGTFKGRWSTVAELPPAMVEIERPARPPPPPIRMVQRAAPRDVCARHGMRKVLTRSGRSWRCRR